MSWAVAALTMVLAACGGSGNGKGNGDASYITYTNSNFNYSVEVPDGLDKRETLTEDNGTIYSADGPEGFTLNRIDIGAHESVFVEEYTPEKIKEDFDEEVEGLGEQVSSKECGDNFYTITIKSDDLTEVRYNIFKGNKSLNVTICYDAAHEKQLGGEVAEHVFKSMKFN